MLATILLYLNRKKVREYNIQFNGNLSISTNN